MPCVSSEFRIIYWKRRFKFSNKRFRDIEDQWCATVETAEKCDSLTAFFPSSRSDELFLSLPFEMHKISHNVREAASAILARMAIATEP